MDDKFAVSEAYFEKNSGQSASAPDIERKLFFFRHYYVFTNIAHNSNLSLHRFAVECTRL